MNILKNKFRKFSMSSMLTYLLILIITLPIIAIISRVNFAPDNNWEHFKKYVLPDSVNNTIVLVISTLLLAGLTGALLAIAVTLFDFPFKRLFAWALYIPLTIPPYIASYVYAGMLGYTGFVQVLLRELGISHSSKWFDIMNIQGAIFIYSITLYPYIYGAVKSFLENHSGSLLDAARVLGYNPIKLIIKVIFPLIRMPVMGGLMLVMMEVISEYGVVKYFNIQTVSYTIFNSWFGMGETGIAIRLSFYVMLIIITIQFIEDMLRGRKKYNIERARIITVIKLKGIKGYALSICMFLVIAIAFLIPVGQMIVWAVLSYKKVSLTNLSSIIFNSLFYGILATTVILILNIFIIHSQRWMSTKSGLIMSKLAQLGYSIPGAVIAIGTITAFVSLDSLLYPIYRFFDSDAKKLLISTSIIMLIFAFVVRYMAVGYNSVNSGFSKVGRKFNDAARVLGVSKTRAMLKVELQMIKGSLTAGFILTFIDIIKELPLTLLLRPFNYNTLASRAYEYANDERIYEASVPSLIIVLLSLISILLLVRFGGKKGGITK